MSFFLFIFSHHHPSSCLSLCSSILLPFHHAHLPFSCSPPCLTASVNVLSLWLSGGPSRTDPRGSRATYWQLRRIGRFWNQGRLCPWHPASLNLIGGLDSEQLYSGDDWFECRTGHRLSWPRSFPTILAPSFPPETLDFIAELNRLLARKLPSLSLSIRKLVSYVFSYSVSYLVTLTDCQLVV